MPGMRGDQSLFEHARKQHEWESAPLAARMRPRTLEEYAGQQHLLGPGHILERAIREDHIPSMVLWGPPGVGKTTLARLIAGLTKSHFIALSAVTSGVADLRNAVEEAREALLTNEQGTILFIDEVHRFNKSQQDAILPHVENGTVVFIGATTENPSFEVVAPLLSRARVLKLEPLTDEELIQVIDRALADTERGLGHSNVVVEPEARAFLLEVAAGDARVALNAIELATSVTTHDTNGVKSVDQSTMQEVLQRRSPMYDKGGDSHYDTISAFIKSIRASDPDAAVYWLARMLEAGEDAMFIARRIVISASEDVGMADPQALSLAVAAQQAVHFIGLPEGAIPLAEITVYLATAPKSNASYMALNRARDEVRNGRQWPVPLHLRNAATDLMKSFGYGEGYQYAHDYKGHFAGQRNLPEEMGDKRFYEPGTLGYEATVKERLEAWWRVSRAQGDGGSKT
jgi:putative ATPase